MDIVSIRNLLIYFNSDLQKRIIPLLHYSLNEGGILFLGTAETIGEVPDSFITIDSKWRIYRSINKQKGQPVAFTGQPATWKPLDDNLPAAPIPRTPAPGQLLLEALPPSVLVNHNRQVIYTHGDTSRYLHLPEGNPSTGILEMINPDLRMALATALHEASQGQKETIREGVRSQHYGGTQSVKITVRSLNKTDGVMSITFEDVRRPKRRKTKGETLTEAKQRELEQELQLAKDTLHGTIEELETANEELRSANEEYMSTNEELKSANEELETSREELRSVNEELTTINTEREKKIEELTTVSDDMRNLLNSTGIATIFLDEKLRIRRFTPSITELFKLISSDLGRPLEDIASHLKDNGLTKTARKVLETLIPSEQEVQTDDGKWYSMRIHPYRTTFNTIEGVVATFVDINLTKDALSYTQSIIDTIREPLLVLSEELKVISASRAFYRTFRVTKKSTEGKFIYDLGNHQWDIPQLRRMLTEVLLKDRVFEGFRIEHSFPGIGARVMLLNARRVFDGIRATRSILLTLEDITDRPGMEPFAQKKDIRKGEASK
jgi:two-component system CheB/CheR fusion protein